MILVVVKVKPALINGLSIQNMVADVSFVQEFIGLYCTAVMCTVHLQSCNDEFISYQDRVVMSEGQEVQCHRNK